MAGLLSDWFGPQSQVGGLLGDANTRLTSAFENPAFQMGIALMAARPGRADEAVANAMQNIALQRAFNANRADRASADARDKRDYDFRVQEATRAQGNADRTAALQEKGLALRDVPSGFRRDDGGNLTYIPGGPSDPAYLRSVGSRQNAPAGYAWSDPNDQTKGVYAIPGGPAEKIGAETAARVGLAKSFLGQLPAIRKRVEAGEATGPIDSVLGWAGYGDAGEIRRQIDSGADALLRNLTGAGMNIAEAKDYAQRYRWQPGDTVERSKSKLDQLERELTSVMNTVSKGRGGMESIMGGNSSVKQTPSDMPAPDSQAAITSNALIKARDAIQRGADPAAVRQRLKDAGINPAGL